MFVNKLLQKLGLDKFISPGTFKNISTLMTGTVISAIIPILTAPIMSRIFAASNYGVLGLYMSISGLIGVLAYSHYTQAIMLPKENSEARQVVWFAISFSTVVSLCAMLVFIMLYFFTNVISSSEIHLWYFFIPVSIFLNGVNAAILTWANRLQSYKQLSYNRVIQALITVVVQITLGILIKNETGLMVGLLTGQLVSVVLLVWKFGTKLETGIGSFESAGFKKIAVQYKNLLFYSTPSEFINNLINQTPIFLLQKFGGISYVGYYSFTQRFLGLPQMFLSSAIVDIFKQKASALYSHTGNCRPLFIKTFKVLTGLAIVPAIVAVLFAPQIFTFVFGARWLTAGIFAQYLSVMFFFRFIASPLSYIYIIAGKLKEDFLIHLFFLFLTTASFYLSNLFFEDKKIMILNYAIAYSFVYIIYLVRSYKFSKA